MVTLPVKKNISISVSTKADLDKLGSLNDTYDSVIKRLIKKHREVTKHA